MDAGIADTINRLDVRLIAEDLDAISSVFADRSPPWYLTPAADTLLGSDTSAKAWVVGIFAAGVPGLHFDGFPADCDWESLFAHFRAEILTRRDPKSPSVHVAESPVRDGVGSQ